jgi:L,D-transpeptidase YcbB
MTINCIKNYSNFGWILILVYCLSASAEAPLQDESVSDYMKSRLQIIQSRDESGEVSYPYYFIRLTEAVYQQLGYRPIWINDNLRQQLLSTLKSAEQHGLNPDDYGYSLLREAFEIEQLTIEQLIDYDLQATEGLFRFLQHIYFGKIDPATMISGWEVNDDASMETALSLIIEAIQTTNLPTLLDTATPARNIYRKLMGGLAYYKGLEMRVNWELPEVVPLLKPDQSDYAIPFIRRRIIAEYGHWLPASLQDALTLSGQSIHYDEATVELVKYFQRRHFLNPDGVIGKGTLSALHISIKEKVGKIKANLERMRWVLKDLPDDFLLVDIAGYVAYGFKNDEVMWRSAIQVGNAYRQTPVFKSRIRYLEWNPTWTIPPTILRKDILPKIAKDIGYLEEKNMVVLAHSGEPIDTLSINWSLYPKKPFPYLIRQRPGPSNALGRVKFIFPNHYFVYLHDTPSRSLFGKTSRAFSSGCVRVEKPFELAMLLMAEGSRQAPENPLTQEAIDAILTSGKTQRMHLQEPLPILLFYWTTKIAEDGAIAFSEDPYDRDKKLLEAL